MPKPSAQVNCCDLEGKLAASDMQNMADWFVPQSIPLHPLHAEPVTRAARDRFANMPSSLGLPNRVLIGCAAWLWELGQACWYTRLSGKAATARAAEETARLCDRTP